MTFLRLLRMYRQNNWSLRTAIKQAWKVSRHA